LFILQWTLRLRIVLKAATPAEAAVVAKIRNAAADGLTAQYGKGHWSSQVSERGVLLQMKFGTVYIAKKNGKAVATLTLSRKKPWAHDRSYFTDCKNPRYLTGMAVDPRAQRKGIGMGCIRSAVKIAAELPCEAICLDAYDHAAGAGGLYRKCGFKEVGKIVYRNTPLTYFEWLL
jgi:ribosomal protein S18 acetylase RimI-like enzyme